MKINLLKTLACAPPWPSACVGDDRLTGPTPPIHPLGQGGAQANVFNTFRPEPKPSHALRLLLAPVWVALLALSLTGCGNKDPESPVVARYRDAVLTQADLKAAMPAGLTQADSANFAQNYLQQWYLEQIVAAKALEDLPDLEQKVQKRVDDYRRKLLMVEYYAYLVEQQMNPNVTQNVLVKYYEEHKAQFVADADLYQYYYIKTNNEDSPQIRKRLVSGNADDLNVVRQWVEKNASTYKLDDQWYESAQVEAIETVAQQPLRTLPPGSPVVYFTSTENDKPVYHFFYLKGVVAKGQPMPLENVRQQITDIVLSQRRNMLIEAFEAQVLQEAQANQELKTQ